MERAAVNQGHCIDVRSATDYEAGLCEAVSFLRKGGIVAFPTESFYGLAVNVHDEKAIQRLFAIKKRRSDQPILLLISSIDVLESIVTAIPDSAWRLMEHFWPGGLTLIFDAVPGISPLLTAGSGKIGIRLSSHPIATTLTRMLGAPITGTSANLSGTPACQTAHEVFDTLGTAVDCILDGGRTAGGAGSTICDVTVMPPVILREGMIGKELLERVYEQFE